jgi:hypothetical protein
MVISAGALCWRHNIAVPARSVQTARRSGRGRRSLAAMGTMLAMLLFWSLPPSSAQTPSADATWATKY